MSELLKSGVRQLHPTHAKLDAPGRPTEGPGSGMSGVNGYSRRMQVVEATGGACYQAGSCRRGACGRRYSGRIRPNGSFHR